MPLFGRREILVDFVTVDVRGIGKLGQRIAWSEVASVVAHRWDDFLGGESYVVIASAAAEIEVGAWSDYYDATLDAIRDRLGVDPYLAIFEVLSEGAPPSIPIYPLPEAAPASPAASGA